MFALTNACQDGEDEEIEFLVRNNLIELLVESCDKVSNKKIFKACVEALADIIDHGETIKLRAYREDNPFTEKMLECNGYVKLERLQNSADKDTFNVINKILDKENP